ncbi:MAG TPA: glycosyl transferase family 4 [Candidatus Pacearchaeota archaeon]|nr:glycosyl transferase family 4 [Candidatus Pacearchaeota archaeon]HOR52253.1 glycosyl transferase family 4 [Candidatus Pacearchaeota archaeon]HOU79426.1 glycosyl transferase family 4 [Candidatus Pacearchaeota archaeon]HPJ87286.1 glycosyl transferase family 4 [Candidatus Pacearchaeota archaeon]HQF83077.1 glycosyl transferase family 4 [Candidatus Pacearchaeota archaeon]
MEPLIVMTVFLSFFCTYLTLPFWIKKAKQIGLLWEDMNKPRREKNVAGSGGIIVVIGAIIGIFMYIAIQTFYFKSSDGISIQLFAMTSTILLVAGVGLIDDLFGWKKGGLSKRSRIILVMLSAIPLMIINAGESTMLGMDFGILFPLVIIPLGVVGATTTFNFLAGFNGLEARQGIILLSAIGIVTYLTGNSWLTVVALCLVASLLAFYIFNANPAKVFPGDTLTYAIGASFACIAILGNVEKIAIFFFIPYLLETILKLRGGLKKQSFGRPNEDGSLEMPYEKIYGLEHLAIYILKKIKPSKKVYENDVVSLINLFQIIIIIIGFVLFIKF